MKFSVGDKVQRIWSGPPGVWIVTGIIRVPPARWDPEGAEQISYQLVTARSYWGSNSIVPEDELKPAEIGCAS
ncbi:hypothetical protein CL634_10675 [bacterium]|nr:hypothetical protein [bacterium]|tara:strand:+ start:390 stop:608 length:219 start_codon:yes stop_codon:yes gene_type:complete